ncbi:MAG TPA: hypothetical protein VGP07_08970 [Polyangia bacterium]|jgi:hypothetical protein
MRPRPIRLRDLGRSPAVVIAVVLSAPAPLWAHERWVMHAFKPFNRDYFRSMSGEVLHLSLLAAAAVAVIIGLWYLGATVLLDRLTPTSVEKQLEREQRGSLLRPLGALLRFFLDGYMPSSGMARAERISVLVFARLPGLVFLLGAAESWVVMPSFPVVGQLGLVLRTLEVVVGLWILSGWGQVWLGGVLMAVFTGLCAGYGLAAVDAIPVLASAFFYLFSRRGIALNAQQVAGIRFGLGVGFFLLGLVNKIYDAELFIGVGDSYPYLVTGPQKMIPWLTRESWSFTTALGEMTFGLLLLLGVFSRLTSLALALIFANFILVFGWAEIVHLYPIAGFAVLFFHASPGTALDGILFRTHVRAWRAMGYRTSFLLYRAAVVVVAVTTGGLLLFAPLYLAVQLVPRVFGH